ncbi:MAG: pyridoxal phosphate-dependent aminotransferase [Betaproteobacteria bacterium]|jgi:aspartate/methionine/tyrosine aminotransferase
MKLASRVERIEPFWVMEMAKTAREVAAGPACDPARGGEPMIYLNIGEPDFTASAPVQAAAQACLQAGQTAYTQATGLPALRTAISAWYAQRFGLDIAPERILVTAGASAALQLVCLALFEAGDEVLMPDPCYPCNRHFVTAAGGQARLLPCGPAQRFQLDAAGVEAAWTPATRGVVLASPSNPTGTSIDPAEMGRIVQAVRARGGVTVVDEIYLGLSYEARFGHSALAHGDDVISVNSFSKYFSMTGWRLGWVVLPPALVPAVEKLAQNLYICASSLAQHAALACFTDESIAEYEQRRGEFQRRRDVVLAGLERIGLQVPVAPDGAFYAWADCSAFSASSWDLCHGLLHSAHVALTPGRDFGPAAAERYLRLSYASAMPQLTQALARLQRVLHAG